MKQALQQVFTSRSRWLLQILGYAVWVIQFRALKYSFSGYTLMPKSLILDISD
jgi:hypothetical protein